MIAYKGFRPGLICRGYQFVMGLNTTEKANCRENGFHCAEDPLDCLSYYSSLEHSEYYIVNAGGDIDEDEHDSKIACTELTVIKRLTKEELFLHGLAYMVDHPRRVWSSHVAANRAMANCGYAVVRGKDPVATGRLGDILAFAKEAPDSESIVQVAVGRIDGVTLKPKPLRIAQVIQIRLSQARLSSTVRPEREKFMSSKATEAVTMAAIVEMARIWVYTSCMISLALVHTSVAA